MTNNVIDLFQDKSTDALKEAMEVIEEADFDGLLIIGYHKATDEDTDSIVLLCPPKSDKRHVESNDMIAILHRVLQGLPFE